MTDQQAPEQPEGAERPRRTLADAATELRAILAAQRARARNGGTANGDLRRELDRLQQRVERRRASAEKGPGDE